MLVIMEVAQTNLARKRESPLHAILYDSCATATDNLLLIACDAGRESVRMAFMLLVGELKAYSGQKNEYYLSGCQKRIGGQNYKCSQRPAMRQMLLYSQLLPLYFGGGPG
jgi:hypothetical protein